MFVNVAFLSPDHITNLSFRRQLVLDMIYQIVFSPGMLTFIFPYQKQELRDTNYRI